MAEPARRLATRMLAQGQPGVLIILDHLLTGGHERKRDGRFGNLLSLREQG